MRFWKKKEQVKESAVGYEVFRSAQVLYDEIQKEIDELKGFEIAFCPLMTSSVWGAKFHNQPLHRAIGSRIKLLKQKQKEIKI